MMNRGFDIDSDWLSVKMWGHEGVPFSPIATLVSHLILPDSPSVSSLDLASYYLKSEHYEGLTANTVCDDRTGLSSPCDMLRFVQSVLTWYELSAEPIWHPEHLASAMVATIKECGPKSDEVLSKFAVFRHLQLVTSVPHLREVDFDYSGKKLELHAQLEITLDYLDEKMSDYEQDRLPWEEKLEVVSTNLPIEIENYCSYMINYHLSPTTDGSFYHRWLRFVVSLSAAASHRICGLDEAKLLVLLLKSKSTVPTSDSYSARFLFRSNLARQVLESIREHFSLGFEEIPE